MRSYIQIAVEFSSLSIKDKEDYLLNVLSIDELKLFNEGSTVGWCGYINYIYMKRVSENRNKKMNDIGI